MMDAHRYLTPVMISNILHIGMNQTYKLFQAKGFPAVKIGKKWMVDEEKFEKFMDELEGSGIQI